MNPVEFPEANSKFGPPSDLEESQCRTISAYQGEAKGGSCDGLKLVVVAYEVSMPELDVIERTGIIYLTMVGGLAPHFLALSFHDATHPA